MSGEKVTADTHKLTSLAVSCQDPENQRVLLAAVARISRLEKAVREMADSLEELIEASEEVASDLIDEEASTILLGVAIGEARVQSALAREALWETTSI